MRQYLASGGWTIVEAPNGRAALDVFADARPDVIVLDLMMPEMNGFEFLTELRLYAEWRAVPVVVVTARDLTDADRHRLNGGVERVIQKRGSAGDSLFREVGEALAACLERAGG